MQKTTYMVFLLDQTGSMESIKDDTIGGFNAFLDGLDSKLPFEITLIAWDSIRQEVLAKEGPPADVPRLNAKTYVPVELVAELVREMERMGVPA